MFPFQNNMKQQLKTKYHDGTHSMMQSFYITSQAINFINRIS